MAQSLFELNGKVQRFVRNLPNEIDKVVMANEKFVVNLVQNQLLDGETPDDTPITPSYRSPFYANFKNRMNPRPTRGVPDLRLTGGYYAGIHLIGRYPRYELIGTNEKTPMLHAKYGDNLGFNKLNSQSFVRKNDKDLAVSFKKATGL